MSSNEVPDLASILKTLASLAPQNQQQHPAGEEPLQALQPAPYITPHVQLPQQAWQPYVQTPAANTKPPPVNTKLIDPATIIDWSSGLKCVMRTIAKHENMLQDIRRMIKVQHENEVQWWSSRQALIERQKAREEGQKKLDSVLKLVGGDSTTSSSNISPEEMGQELKIFDTKEFLFLAPSLSW